MMVQDSLDHGGRGRYPEGHASPSGPIVSIVFTFMQFQATIISNNSLARLLWGLRPLLGSPGSAIASAHKS